MVKHLFKLIWNKKKQNFLLITEMLVSFIVIFSVFSLLVYFYQNYKKPIGFQYENVWAIRFNQPDNIKSKDSLTLFYAGISNLLHSMPQIKHTSFTGANYPFATSTHNNNVTYHKNSIISNFYTVQDDYANALNLKLIEGRWFNKSDEVNKDKPVVINEKLKEKLFKNESPVGKILGEAPNTMRITGVATNFKDKGDYHALSEGIFVRMDTTTYNFISTILINVQPTADAAFESRLFKSLSNAIGSSIEVRHLTGERKSINKITLVPMMILFIVAGFLIINVALGLFGVLWYNISKRKSEIGLRRAVGASGNSISKQLVGEALVLATISLVVGSFFAVQFPLMNVFDLAASTYLIALALAIFFIYLLVIVCALYPAKQAAAIFPANALHED
ncbi:MAG: FtsX-like permease family protein [Ferruginibacter sp.]|nr:FtsX-like permease family protein [Ferruginibacter sp.]